MQLAEGKALFHGGNMKVDVQSEFSGSKRGEKKIEDTHLQGSFLSFNHDGAVCYCK